MNTIPVIDVAQLTDGAPDEMHSVAKALGNSSHEVGFFYVSRHGMPPALIRGRHLRDTTAQL